MSVDTLETSLKRKSQNLESVEDGEVIEEPQTKLQKTDEDTTQPNLKTSDEKISETNTEVVLNDEISTTNDKIETEEQPTTTPCSISIKFHDKSILELYKTKFLQFLNSFAEFRIQCDDEVGFDIYRDETTSVDEFVVDKEDTETEIKVLESSESIVDTITDTTVVINDNTPSPSKKRKKRSRVKKELFVVDATPSPHSTQTDLRYTTRFTINTEKNEEKVAQPSKQSCFNCDQLHALKDCPEPRDYNKINAARQKFRQQPKSSRYHLEEDQKFSHLVPGKLSNELRKALGLYKNEAPHFVYMMRQLGYPPGWLEEAKLVHSNLDMFDIDGNHVKAGASKKRGLDPEKIVNYPGFNVPFEKGTKDDYRKYGVPPYSDDYSKEAMMKYFEEIVAKEEDNLEACDMDIDQDQESSNISHGEIKLLREVENRDSPSLVDLEQKKKQLLEELNDEVKEDKNVSSTDKDILTSVKTSSFGTPILKSNSPYLSLPNPDNFSKDVSPVINFENLPNSTGKYEQMTDVLQKVRSTLKKINTNI